MSTFEEGGAVAAGGSCLVARSNYSNHSRHTPDNKYFNDEELVYLTVREMRDRLHGLSREAVDNIMQLRCRLRNRHYARRSRQKRHEQQVTLETHIHHLQETVTLLCCERDFYKLLAEQREEELTAVTTPWQPVKIEEVPDSRRDA